MTHGLMDDLIYRQVAVDYLVTKMTWYDEDGCEADEDEKRYIIEELVNGVPSAQLVIISTPSYTTSVGVPMEYAPIVRCKDCKYGEQDEDGWWFCRSIGCQVGGKDGSGFCADAERRIDE